MNAELDKSKALAAKEKLLDGASDISGHGLRESFLAEQAGSPLPSNGRTTLAMANISRDPLSSLQDRDNWRLTSQMTSVDLRQTYMDSVQKEGALQQIENVPGKKPAAQGSLLDKLNSLGDNLTIHGLISAQIAPQEGIIAGIGVSFNVGGSVKVEQTVHPRTGDPCFEVTLEGQFSAGASGSAGLDGTLSAEAHAMLGASGRITYRFSSKEEAEKFLKGLKENPGQTMGGSAGNLCAAEFSGGLTSSVAGQLGLPEVLGARGQAGLLGDATIRLDFDPPAISGRIGTQLDGAMTAALGLSGDLHGTGGAAIEFKIPLRNGANPGLLLTDPARLRKELVLGEAQANLMLYVDGGIDRGSLFLRSNGSGIRETLTCSMDISLIGSTWDALRKGSVVPLVRAISQMGRVDYKREKYSWSGLEGYIDEDILGVGGTLAGGVRVTDYETLSEKELTAATVASWFLKRKFPIFGMSACNSKNSESLQHEKGFAGDDIDLMTEAEPDNSQELQMSARSTRPIPRRPPRPSHPSRPHSPDHPGAHPQEPTHPPGNTRPPGDHSGQPGPVPHQTMIIGPDGRPLPGKTGVIVPHWNKDSRHARPNDPEYPRQMIEVAEILLGQPIETKYASEGGGRKMFVPVGDGKGGFVKDKDGKVLMIEKDSDSQLYPNKDGLPHRVGGIRLDGHHFNDEGQHGFDGPHIHVYRVNEAGIVEGYIVGVSESGEIEIKKMD